MKSLITFQVEPKVQVRLFEDFSPDWSWADHVEMQAVEEGRLSQFIIEVTAFDASGEVSGIDSLGGVALYSHDVNQDVIQQYIDDHGMVGNAKADLKDRLARVISLNGGAA